MDVSWVRSSSYLDEEIQQDREVHRGESGVGRRRGLDDCIGARLKSAEL